MFRPWRCVFLVLLTLLTLTRPAFAGPKTDIVELKNGDRITCEIKKLERGKLTVKTDGMSTLSIEWNDVARIVSSATYDVERSSGERLFGTLIREDAGSLTVVGPLSSETLVLDDVVRIAPLGGSLWARLDGSFSAGFNFTQANVQTQWTLDTEVIYRARKWMSQLDADSALTTREDVDGTSRNTLSLQSQRFWVPRLSTVGFAQFQQNEELSLDLRTVIGGGVQRIFLQSNRTLFQTLGGVALTRERYVDLPSTSIAEAVVAIGWDWFTFDGRSTNLDTGTALFYALDGTSRFRLEQTTSFKSDIVGDLYWSINLAESYNSKPPTGQNSNDSTISAAIGWSF